MKKKTVSIKVFETLLTDSEQINKELESTKSYLKTKNMEIDAIRSNERDIDMKVRLLWNILGRPVMRIDNDRFNNPRVLGTSEALDLCIQNAVDTLRANSRMATFSQANGRAAENLQTLLRIVLKDATLVDENALAKIKVQAEVDGKRPMHHMDTANRISAREDDMGLEGGMLIRKI